jgi:hypothetical protein
MSDAKVTAEEAATHARELLDFFGTSPKISRGEYSGTSPKIKRRGRGRSKRSIDLIEEMYEIARAAQPITGRGIGYKLFARGRIPSMSENSMKAVYRLLKLAREDGTIPWDWIVDETRATEIVATWANPNEFSKEMTTAYRRNFWNQQPIRCEVWSEKGTVRGVLRPVLDELGVGFQPVHGFNSATMVYKACRDDDGRDLVIFYVGDYDPSGMCMSAMDLPKRFEEYGGHHLSLERLAVKRDQLSGLSCFPASDKKKDTRYKWFVANYGDQCAELDAMDPNVLRDLVKKEVEALIEPVAWARCEAVNKAERESIKNMVATWANGEKKSPPRSPHRARYSFRPKADGGLKQ